ncbi:MAG: 2-polyprenyl-3-methyl-6-methoxy-1,4-benzoquinone monooxygenase [Gammaproteobacteria bacterium]|nr:2-polyprenyl-3-methyl-6-methoxy-1,4-benzoquinone monooxygenase [Gammaproteobacteria bacterium]
MTRQYSLLDKVLMEVDTGLSTLVAELKSGRPNPAEEITSTELSASERRQSTGMMRVNHSGEVCAQALYRGQLTLARKPKTRTMLNEAAVEEVDHLAWTHQRLQELDGHRSLLNPFWYFNSFLIGMFAAAISDRYSLGFVEETEHQVGAHLSQHLGKLPVRDKKSQAIVKQMRDDELEHGAAARKAGGADLPEPVKRLMALHGRVMTTLAYYV